MPSADEPRPVEPASHPADGRSRPTDAPAHAVDLSRELLAGYRRFRAIRYAEERERYRSLAEEGQRPRAMIVACSDSRSGPETVFDARPGELFVVRNIAALVPAYAPDAANHGASAALEFGVRTLHVATILVMGHGRCGGIAAALRPEGESTESDFVGTWVREVRRVGATLPPDLEPAERQLSLEHASVERSIANLRTFPWIAEAERDGSLTIAGAWFDISLGELHLLTPDGWTPVEDGWPLGQ